MKHRWGIALIVAGCLWAAPWVCAQGQTEKQAQDQQDKKQQQGTQPDAQGKGNPFPTNTTNVPVMPSKVTPDVPEAPVDESAGAKYSLPSSDADPMASPDDAGSSNSEPQVSSSNVKGLESILPPPDEEPAGKQGRNGRNTQPGPPKEDPKQDISVGNYYLDNKNWKAALSRFQSALVLAPEDPDVYWGLAESQRHLGDYASAKANYMNVIVFDPDSKRAKEAKKALKDPEIANAKAAAEGQKPQ